MVELHLVNLGFKVITLRSHHSQTDRDAAIALFNYLNKDIEVLVASDQEDVRQEGIWLLVLQHYIPICPNASHTGSGVRWVKHVPRDRQHNGKQRQQTDQRYHLSEPGGTDISRQRGKLAANRYPNKRMPRGTNFQQRSPIYNQQIIRISKSMLENPRLTGETDLRPSPSSFQVKLHKDTLRHTDLRRKMKSTGSHL